MADETKTPDKAEPPKNDIPVTPAVPVKKPSFFGAFLKTVIVGDVKDISKQLLTNLIVPRMKNTICDLIDQGARGMIYGDTSAGKNGSNNKTEYNSIFEGRPTSSATKVVPISSVSTSYTKPQAGSYDTVGYNTCWYETRELAYSILQKMRIDIAQTGYCTVASYYLYSKRGELVNNNYTANYYGWRNLEEAYPYESSNGLWRIAFPYNPIRINTLK